MMVKTFSERFSFLGDKLSSDSRIRGNAQKIKVCLHNTGTSFNLDQLGVNSKLSHGVE